LSKRENSISFFGKNLKKETYKIIHCSIIVLLLISLLYFVYKYINSNFLTKEAKNNLADIKEDFEQHKKILVF